MHQIPESVAEWRQMYRHDNGAFPISYMKTTPHSFLISDLDDVRYQLSRAHSDGFLGTNFSVDALSRNQLLCESERRVRQSRPLSGILP